jgi:hypothetical protein
MIVKIDKKTATVLLEVLEKVYPEDEDSARILGQTKGRLEFGKQSGYFFAD